MRGEFGNMPLRPRVTKCGFVGDVMKGERKSRRTMETINGTSGDGRRTIPMSDDASTAVRFKSGSIVKLAMRRRDMDEGTN